MRMHLQAARYMCTHVYTLAQLYPPIPTPSPTPTPNHMYTHANTCTHTHTHAHIHTQVCDTVAELGAELADEEAPGATQWPELVPFMFQCVQSGQPSLMESGACKLRPMSSGHHTKSQQCVGACATVCVLGVCVCARVCVFEESRTEQGAAWNLIN